MGRNDLGRIQESGEKYTPAYSKCCILPQLYWIRDWNFQSLNFEAESETPFSERQKLSKSQTRDRVRDHRISQDQD